MKQFISICLIACLFLASCQGDQTKETEIVSGYTWTKLLDSAPWKKSYNFQMFDIRDTLWTFHPDGNWFSTDGRNWVLSPLPNVINNLAFLDYVQFNDAIYGLGHFEGNIEQFSFKPTIYRTTDMRHWDVMTDSSNLPVRFFYHPFVFNNNIWIIGGEDKNTQYADIWNSSNGVNWLKQKDSLEFGKRNHNQVITLNDKLYLLGNDVWVSTDALNWKKETNEIMPGIPLFGYSVQVMDNKVWLLGCNRNGQFSSQVLMSGDLKNWQSMDAPWTPRGGIASTIHQGKIYMTGGKYGGTTNQPEFRYSNDVWILEKTK